MSKLFLAFLFMGLGIFEFYQNNKLAMYANFIFAYFNVVGMELTTIIEEIKKGKK